MQFSPHRLIPPSLPPPHPLQRFPRRATLRRMRINVHVLEGYHQAQQASLLMALLSSATARLAGLMSLTVGWDSEYSVRARLTD